MNGGSGNGGDPAAGVDPVVIRRETVGADCRFPRAVISAMI